jgi:tetratricopeptide (TPR) repeat protein
MVISKNLDLYVGPRSFEAQDKNIFFGREREANDLLSLAMAYPVLLVYSQSGAGKTSLINARLKPDLEEHGFEVLNIVRMQIPLPDGIKLEVVDNIFVYKTLLNLEGENYSFEKQTLSIYLKNRPPEMDEDGFPKPRVIIFDQFEELFTLHAERWNDRKQFFIQIRNAIAESQNVAESSPLGVIFSMREDYVAHIEQYIPEIPNKLITRYRLELLRKDQALNAINGPLRNSGISFEPGVAEKLVDELLKVRMDTDTGERIQIKGEFVEPVQLQLICQNLLENLPDNVNQISQEHVGKFGDVDRTLSRFYEDVLQSAVQVAFVEERILRDWFGKVLITPAGTRGTVYRGSFSTAGIPNDAVDVLESKHIIRAEYRAGARWYELTHDRLIDPILGSNKIFQLKNTNQYEAENDSQKALRLVTQAEQAEEGGDYEGALKPLEEAKEVYQHIGDQRGIANTLVSVGNIYLLQGKLRDVINIFNEAFELFTLLDDTWGSMSILVKMAKIYDKLADTDQALTLREQAIVEAVQASENDKESTRFFERLKQEDSTFAEMQLKFEQERDRYLETVAKSDFTDLSVTSLIVRAAYSDRTAWLLAVMAQLSYLAFEEHKDIWISLTSNLKSGNFQLIQTFANEQTGTYAFLAKNNEFAVLAFRGTGQINGRDINTDLGTRISVVGGRVHAGFKLAYESVAKDIEKSLISLSGLPLYITGHSLGAALATVATQLLERNQHIRKTIAACYTFGSPRVAISQYDVDFKSPIYRIVNSMDIVTMIPLLSVGYIHIGDMRYLGRRDGEFRRGIPNFERYYLFLAAIFRLYGPFARNHSINEYVRKLKVIAEKRNRFGY